ncbi:MAG: hypothetical protein JNK87_13995 [Bryobacterales bacterium]|nr:hypothetical protein [Bryobacterales bacterium]
MMPAHSPVEAGIWSVPGHPLVIEYSRAAIHAIIVEVLDAYETYLEGGYEVGGLLLGTRDGSHLRILSHAVLPIRPPRPSFVLSESDQRRLAELIKTCAQDREVLGFYVSHTRSEVFLTESDQELLERFFPEPWQVGLVFHPKDREPVRAGFFFREEDGYVRSDQSYLEMAFEAPPRNPGFRRQPPWQIDSRGVPIAPPVREPEPDEHPEPGFALLPDEGEPDAPPLRVEVPERPDVYDLPPEPAGPTLAQRVGKGALLAAVLLVLFAGAVSIQLLREPDPPMGLRVVPREGEMVVVWDPASPTLQEANEISISLTDGASKKEVPVRLASRPPEYVYRPATGRVDIRLTATSGFGRQSREMATFLAHPEIGKPSPELAEERRLLQEAERDFQAATAAVETRNAENLTLESRLGELQSRQAAIEEARRQRLEARRAAVQAAANRRAPAAPVRDLPQAPEIASRTPAVRLPVPSSNLPPRPVEPEAPRLAPTPSNGGGPSVTPTTAAPGPLAARTTPPPIAVAAPKPSAYAGPRSGRIIWTGELPRDGQLVIDGRKPSRGFVNGELPGVPVRLGAYPAELADGGIRVLTGNPSFSQPKVENPSAANAWNRTQYVYDPKGYRDLIVEQMPAGSDLKKLTLRAGGKKLSVIVIEWQVMAP